MIKLKNTSEISGIRESGHLLAETLAEVKKMISPGITTIELDQFAYNYLVLRKAKPAFLGYYDYPASLCISINNEVIHGIPGKRKLIEGDIVGVDCGVILNGYVSDACFSTGVGKITEKRNRLLKITRECLFRAIDQAVSGKRLKDISTAIYTHAKSAGYDVVRKYCGHGTGFELHEDPQVFNYISSGSNPRLKPGMVLAIEPMVNEGTFDVNVLEDGWTVVTADGRDSAHFEHTVAIREDKAEILTEGFL